MAPVLRDQDTEVHMRPAKISAAVSALLALTFVSAYAGQAGNSGSHGPTTTTTHGPVDNDPWTVRIDPWTVGDERLGKAGEGFVNETHSDEARD